MRRYAESELRRGRKRIRFSVCVAQLVIALPTAERVDASTLPSITYGHADPVRPGLRTGRGERGDRAGRGRHAGVILDVEIG